MDFESTDSMDVVKKAVTSTVKVRPWAQGCLLSYYDRALA